MKIIQVANNKKKITISKTEWLKIGQKTNWLSSNKSDFKKKASEECPSQLEMGIEIEKEHKSVWEKLKSEFNIGWTLEEFAEKIAQDHIKEDPKYYSKLHEIEGECCDICPEAKQNFKIEVQAQRAKKQKS